MRRAGLAGAAVAAAMAALGATLAACGGGTPVDRSAAKISVDGAYIPLPASPDMAAAYFRISNGGGTSDRLVAVSSPDARSAEIDASTATSMDRIDGLDVPGHATALLARGGRHVMLMGLSPAPEVGRAVDLRLTFEHSGTVTVHATVQPLTYQPPK